MLCITRLYEEEFKAPFSEGEENKERITGALDDILVLRWPESIRFVETIKGKV